VADDPSPGMGADGDNVPAVCPCCGINRERYEGLLDDKEMQVDAWRLQRAARRIRTTTLRLLARAHMVNPPVTDGEPAALTGIGPLHPWSGVRSGVYFLLLEGVVVYVGQSVTVDARIIAHVSAKEFDQAWWTPCDPTKLDETEQRYIDLFRPTLNKRRGWPHPHPKGQP
jgi:hypothetical protein